MTGPFDLVASGDLAALRATLASDAAAVSARHASGASLLAWAAYLRNAEAVALVRAAMPEVAPHDAIILGDTAAVEAALAAGWDPDTPAPDGFTALALAAFFGHEALFDRLLPLTGDINRRAANPQQVAALHAATATRSATMVAKLLRAGADPDLPQAEGFLPLHVAAQHGDAAISALLVLFGASPQRRNEKGKSAIDHAREGGHDWLADRLAALPPPADAGPAP